MQVFKFGSTSINSFERIKNLSWILQHHKNEKILIVISAMGKMTPTLQKVAQEYYEGKQHEALLLFESVKSYHLSFLKYLITYDWQTATKDLERIIKHTENILHSSPVNDYNYYNDQIVSSGDLLSSTLISHFLREEKIPNTFVNACNIMKTDGTFRNGKVNREGTNVNIQMEIIPLFEKTNFVVTQSILGRDDLNNPTTHGGEGSDYTAAIFANLLKAESVTLWREAEGIMTGDPREIKDAVVLEDLSYKVVVEMAFYGADVPHPKTIKLLQNENIPLYVKSFLHPQLPGTAITAKPPTKLPPIIVYRHDQALIVLESIDFTFVEGEPANRLHELLGELKLRPNLTQNTAISLLICVDNLEEKIQQLASACSKIFRVHIQKELLLLTIRHHNPEIIREKVGGKTVVLEQKTPETIQLLMVKD